MSEWVLHPWSEWLELYARANVRWPPCTASTGDVASWAELCLGAVLNLTGQPQELLTLSQPPSLSFALPSLFLSLWTIFFIVSLSHLSQYFLLCSEPNLGDAAHTRVCQLLKDSKRYIFENFCFVFFFVGEKTSHYSCTVWNSFFSLTLDRKVFSDSILSSADDVQRWFITQRRRGNEWMKLMFTKVRPLFDQKKQK